MVGISELENYEMAHINDISDDVLKILYQKWANRWNIILNWNIELEYYKLHGTNQKRVVAVSISNALDAQLMLIYVYILDVLLSKMNENINTVIEYNQRFMYPLNQRQYFTFSWRRVFCHFVTKALLIWFAILKNNHFVFFQTVHCSSQVLLQIFIVVHFKLSQQIHTWNTN